ncbi:hypothetical protein ACWGB8_04065 [Kitasatospora sp. NPDC054939]
MDDTPQGGAGGVPLHHDEDHSTPHGGRPAPGKAEPADAGPAGAQKQADDRDSDTGTVPTVRGGKPVAEQQSGPAAPTEEQE